MIRTLQDRAVALGHRGLHGVHGHPADHGAAPGSTGAFGYWRTTGQPIVFPAKAIVLATGGIGKAYEVTSNSWEYSGDGQALAYEAGAELIDMEFVQFHPTGMVWPPGVRGLLVTEAVRGEGGILRNNDGERFMWTYLPEDRRAEYAATDEEAARWVTALSEGRETDARRPPELSTRDNVARAIYTEVKEGRGSPHGGVFLDISYLPAETRPAQAAVDVRAVQGAGRRRHHDGTDGGRADDPLRDGRDPGRCRDRRDDRPRAVRGGRGRRRDARREPARRQLAVGPARVRGADRGRRGGPRGGGRRGARTSTRSRSRTAVAELAAPLERTEGEDPYAIQRDLQEMMQRLVGIFREEADLDEALAELAELRRRWRNVSRDGRPDVQPGLAPRLRAGPPADDLRGDHPERPRADREPRRPQPARLPGDRRRRLGPGQHRRGRGRRWLDDGHHDTTARDDRRAARPARRSDHWTEDRCRTHT